MNTLLTIDMPMGKPLTMDWEPWFRVMGLPDLRMKNTLRFSQYSDVVGAAVAGQGVAIGRLPLLAELLRDGRLVQLDFHEPWMQTSGVPLPSAI